MGGMQNVHNLSVVKPAQGKDLNELNGTILSERILTKKDWCCAYVRMTYGNDQYCVPNICRFTKFDIWVSSKIRHENLISVKIGWEHRVLYMMTFSHLWQYLPDFFLEWEVFQIEVVEKFKTRVSYPVTFFRKSWCLRENVEKCCGVGEAADNLAHARSMLET